MNDVTALPGLDPEGQGAGGPASFSVLGQGDVVGQAPAAVIQFLLDDVYDGPTEPCLVLEAGEATQEQDQIHIGAVVQRCPLPRGAALRRTSMLSFTSSEA